jgi:3-phosphoinositide dependent protein kinase-1
LVSTELPSPPTTPTKSVPPNKAPPPPVAPAKKKVEDFTFGDVLGEGSFGQVLLATEIATNQVWAAKILNKKHIIKLNKTDTVQREKQVLDALRHPNIVHLYCTFQDADSLCIFNLLLQ